jgi:hypothetical protein
VGRLGGLRRDHADPGRCVPGDRRPGRAVQGRFYVVRPNGLVVNVDYTAWGWTHLLLGVLLIAAGYAVFSGRVWGRTLGVIAALLSAIVNFAFIPAYPVWSILIITVDVLVIYALIAHGGELRKDRY